jgi:regulatory protein
VAFRKTKKTYNELDLYNYAIGALTRKMRSVAELKRLMRQRTTDEKMIDGIILVLKEQKYLNDSAYAAAYSTSRRDTQKLGRRRVITDLKVKGVHGDLIEKAVQEAFTDVNEEQQARAFLQRKRLKKPANEKEAARIFRALMRAGFGPGTAVQILKNWKVDDEVLTALQEEDTQAES